MSHTSDVCDDVSLEAASGCESLPALCAAEGLLSCVNHVVFTHVRQVNCGVFAEVTFVDLSGLFTRGGLDMEG